MTQRNKNSKRNVLTVDALKYCVPIYQEAHKALKTLEESTQIDGEIYYSKELSEEEIVDLISKSNQMEMALNSIIDLCVPLMFSEINKLLASSHVKNQRERVIDSLFYTGVEGIKKGLLKFNVDKLKESSTNYLFQWFNVYAKHELLKIESPYGIPPTRFAKYKKISAVRKRLSTELMREPSNEEILDYFKSGKADLVTLNGPKKKTSEKFNSNQQITIELIREQDHYERILSQTIVVDFRETIEGLEGSFVDDSFDSNLDVFEKFIESHDFNEDAKKVFYAIIDSSGTKSALIRGIEEKEIREIEKQWLWLLTDLNGVFNDFLEKEGLTDSIFPVSKFKSKMTNKERRYTKLFKSKKGKRMASK